MAEEKKRRGRPPLSEEEKALRVKEKEEAELQVELDANATIIQHSLAGLTAPPVNLMDTQEVEKRSLAYFADCTRTGAKVTPPGLALWLGITSADLSDWLTSVGTEEHRRTAARIYQFLHSAFADYALTGKQSSVLSTFLAKNWFGYRDASAVEIAQVVERKKSLDDLAREAAALPDGDVIDVQYKEVKKKSKG